MHSFSGEVATVGRHDDCEIVLDSPAVSRYHARIYCENNHFFIEDLGSRNGTSVNGQVTHSRTLLNDGDQVDISTLPFKFLAEDSLSEASGSWGVKPKIISLSKAGSDSDEDSLRRLLVGAGDQISNEQLGTDGIHQSQIICRISLGDSGGAWPVTNNSTAKLNHTLRLLHSLRQTTQPGDVYSRTMQVLFEVFPAAAHLAIVVRNTQGTGIDVVAAVSRYATHEVCICLPIIRTAMHGSEAVLYAEHWGDDTAGHAKNTVSGMLVAPLMNVVGLSIGAIQMDSSHAGKPLTADDLEQLVVLSHVISFALELALATKQHVNRAVAKQANIDANQLQVDFSPSEPPYVAGYRLAHELIPALDVAGDLVDYARLPDGRLACILIDVPGRGLEATRLMALLSHLLSGALNETGSAGKALTETAAELRLRIDSIPLLISVAIMILEQEKSLVTIAVAGHCPCFLIHGTVLQEFRDETFLGPPLGSESGIWLQTEIQLEENDVLLMFSDGITKLSTPDRETLTRAERAQIILDAAKGQRSVLETRLKSRLAAFQGAGILPDDLAFALIHRRNITDTIDANDLPQIESETMAL